MAGLAYATIGVSRKSALDLGQLVGCSVVNDWTVFCAGYHPKYMCFFGVFFLSTDLKSIINCTGRQDDGENWTIKQETLNFDHLFGSPTCFCPQAAIGAFTTAFGSVIGGGGIGLKVATSKFKVPMEHGCVVF